jgi:hypothetical protein
MMLDSLQRFTSPLPSPQIAVRETHFGVHRCPLALPVRATVLAGGEVNRHIWDAATGPLMHCADLGFYADNNS